MTTTIAKIRTVTIYIGLSILAHLLILFSLGRCGNYNFTTPINPLQAVMVELTKSGDDAPPAADSESLETGRTESAADDVADNPEQPREMVKEVSTPQAVPEKAPVEPRSMEPPAINKDKTEIVARLNEPATVQQPAPPRHMSSTAAIPPPLRTAGEFMSSKSERLSYLISLFGVPVGNMELEAINEKGEVRITLKTRSNSALSSIYPVDDIMETRHLGGNFIITNIRQKEGSYSSNIGFTIFLRDKRVFWLDRLRNRYSNETIPNSEVLDTLSSLYYLRNRPLKTGNTEILHIYDGDTYAPVPIDVVRWEEIRLHNFKKVDSLVLHHVKQKEGIFRRTGDMMIWLTNDGNKVPVKMETTSPVGKVTVELVSAETQQFDRPETQN